LGDFLNPLNPTLASSVTYGDTAAMAAGNVAANISIAANSAKSGLAIGSPGRIALAIRAASWARIGVDLSEASGDLSGLIFILGELHSLNVQGAAIRNGTCEL
jgi:hypothetical protein